MSLWWRIVAGGRCYASPRRKLRGARVRGAAAITLASYIDYIYSIRRSVKNHRVIVNSVRPYS
eukprot:COSAG05_NODE_1574_length_4515_cov_2.683877_1_plen_63_part_00